MRRVAISLLVLAAACHSEPLPPTIHDRLEAADAFTRHYAGTELRKWNIQAHAAGADCNVLFVETTMLLEDSLIEALHYGTGPYAVYDGQGVQYFCHQRAFRGVAYKDRSGHLWTFGKVSVDEVRALNRCR